MIPLCIMCGMSGFLFFQLGDFMDPWKIQSIFERKLGEYVTLIDLCLCKRCLFGQHHHRGRINRILNQNKAIGEHMIDAWVRDVDHGLLHGFLVGFFAF